MSFRVLRVTILFVIATFSASFASATTFGQKEEVQAFIQEMVKSHGFKEKDLKALFSRYEPLDDVIEKIKKPFENVSWGKYQRYLITEDRVQRGVEFWKANKTLLDNAQKAYGVPPEIIVAILGVETFYGKHQGKYPVFQSLATLAFEYPPRSKFFKKELEEFLLLTREQKLNPTTIKGSYAGAMGAPQFIASSYRRYAVDFSKKGQIDLMGDMPTAVGSVANYFKVHGWEPGQPVVHRAHLKGTKNLPVPLAKSSNPKPTVAIKSLTQRGLVPHEKGVQNSAAKVAVLEMENGKNTEHWLARNNFYVITRYNRSSNYAMAVYQLSQRIKKDYQGTQR